MECFEECHKHRHVPQALCIYIIEDFLQYFEPLGDLSGRAIDPWTNTEYSPALQLAPQTGLPHQLRYPHCQLRIMVFTITACAFDDLDTRHQSTAAHVANKRIFPLQVL